MKDAQFLAAAYQRVWDAFLSAGETADGRHDTPAWRAHTGPYAVCVLRVDARELQPHLDELRGTLNQASGVRLHRDHFLHITLQELGFVVKYPRLPDEISAARLEEFAQAAIEPISGMAPIPLSFGGANAFQDAVFLEIGGGAILSRLHGRLFDLAAIPRAPTYPYLPHCTIAHFDGSAPADIAAAAIEPWRNTSFGDITISEVEIVLLDSDEAYPELESYAVIPFGG